MIQSPFMPPQVGAEDLAALRRHAAASGPPQPPSAAAVSPFQTGVLPEIDLWQYLQSVQPQAVPGAYVPATVSEYRPTMTQRAGDVAYDVARSIGVPRPQKVREMISAIPGALDVAKEFTPLATAEETIAGAEEIGRGNIGSGLLQLGMAGVGMLPGGRGATKAAKAARAVRQKGKALPSGRSAPIPGSLRGGETLEDILALRASQMEVPPAKRVQPTGKETIPTSPEIYSDVSLMPPQQTIYAPRPQAGAKLPKKGRAQILIDRTDDIAGVLARKAEGHKGGPAQYFYHAAAPLKKKARELGVTDQEFDDWMSEFSQTFAATSPRTKTEPNLLNTTLAMAKRGRGVPFDEVIGPARMTPGILNEKGYPMIINPPEPGTTGGGGLHRQLLEAVYSGGIDPNVNPKPATFAQNVGGNLEGVTVDTHAIRGVFSALNELAPGSIPDEWLKPSARKVYRADPTKFDPANMIDDSLASQMIDGQKMQTEYGIFSDIYARAAEKAGVSPAEMQSLGWFGSGAETNLGSDLKTVVDLLNDRIDVTSQLTGMPHDEVLKKVFKREIPLASLIGGAALVAAGAGQEPPEEL